MCCSVVIHVVSTFLTAIINTLPFKVSFIINSTICTGHTDPQCRKIPIPVKQAAEFLREEQIKVQLVVLQTDTLLSLDL